MNALRWTRAITGALWLFAAACIAPSVVAPEDRAIAVDSAGLEWHVATADDVPGTYVSTELTGPLAASLRMVVYLFEADGAYTGAALFDDAPPHFEVLHGRWRVDADGLRLDEGIPAALETAAGGWLRLSGDEGRVVLRRERDR